MAPEQTRRLPSPEHPLHGSCLCGEVRFQVTAPFLYATCCHCSRCRKHSGGAALVQGRIALDAFRLLAGEALIETYRPPEGRVKAFCRRCGSSLFGASWPEGPEIAVRFGALDSDPGLRPYEHSFFEQRAPWEDDLDEPRPG